MVSNTGSAWPLKPLSEVVDINPRLDKSAYRDNLEVSFVPMASVEAGSGRMEVSQTKRFGTVKKGYTPFKEGDVLFAKITPCMENGKVAVVPKLVNDLGFGSTEFHVLRPHEGVDAQYVYYFVSNKSFRRDAAHHMTGAVGQKRVPQSFLEEASIPIPLFEEQKRIVAEIEKQFSRLDEAVASLNRTKANLKRYKAAVLKAAVEGKLTEQWRKAHPGVEPASKVLERILAERQAKWSGRGKYKEPLQLDNPHLPSLPKGWIWAMEVRAVKLIGCPSCDLRQGPGRHLLSPSRPPRTA
jgi:type I restriction enzyme S subunit